MVTRLRRTATFRLALAVVLLAVLGGIIHETIRRSVERAIAQAGDRPPGSLLDKVLGIETRTTLSDTLPGVARQADDGITRTMIFDARSDWLVVNHTLRMPREAPELREFRGLYDRSDSLVDRVRVQMAGQRARTVGFRPAQIYLRAEDSVAQVHLNGIPIRLSEEAHRRGGARLSEEAHRRGGAARLLVTIDPAPGSRRQASRLVTDTVVIRTQDVQAMVSPWERVLEQTPELTRFLPGEDGDVEFGLILPDTLAAQALADHPVTLAEHLGNLTRIRIPLVGSAIVGILFAIPFLWFLGLRRVVPAGSDAGRLFTPGYHAVRVYLLLHVATFGIEPLRESTFLLRGAVQGISEWWGLTATGEAVLHAVQALTEPISYGSDLVLLVVCIVVWPALATAQTARWKSADLVSASPKLVTTRLLVVLTCLLTLLLLPAYAWLEVDRRSAWFPVQGFGVPAGVDELSVGIAAATAFVLAVVWLLRDLSAWYAPIRRRVRHALACVAVAAAVGLIYGLVPPWRPRGTVYDWILAVVLFLVAFRLLDAFARLVYPFLERLSGRSRSFRTPFRIASSLLAVALMAAILWGQRSQEYRFGIGIAAVLAHDVRQLFYFAVVLMLFALLAGFARLGREAALLGPGRSVGILLAVMLFFPTHSRWLYVPITFLIGFVLLDRLLLRRGLPASLRTPAGSAERRALVESLIATDARSRAVRSVKKELLKRFSKTEIEPAAYERQVWAAERILGGRTRAWEKWSQAMRRGLLAEGPTASVWENGLIGAGYGALLAIPWAVLYLRDVAADPLPNLIGVGFVVSVALAIAKWSAYGFFFGYFFPVIRGSGGIEKALWLFLVLVLPPLALLALQNPQGGEAWLGFGLWGMQIFIHCMLLGLMIEYAALRKLELGWRELLEFHNLGALTAWGSSMVLAIAAAVTTAITSEAAGLVTLGLQAGNVLTRPAAVAPATASAPPRSDGPIDPDAGGRPP